MNAYANTRCIHTMDHLYSESFRDGQMQDSETSYGILRPKAISACSSDHLDHDCDVAKCSCPDQAQYQRHAWALSLSSSNVCLGAHLLFMTEIFTVNCYICTEMHLSAVLRLMLKRLAGLGASRS